MPEASQQLPPPDISPPDQPHAPSPQPAPLRYLGVVRMMGTAMRAYDLGDGLALLRPVSPLGLEARREWVVPLKGVLQALRSERP